MTNAREIKTIFKPLMQNHPDLFQIGSNFLWMKPINHIARLILIERTSYYDICCIQWSIKDIFYPSNYFLNSFSETRRYLFRRSNSKDNDWLWSDPTMAAEAVAVIEQDTLPFLRTINTLEKYVAYHREHTAPHWPERPEFRMVREIAMGELDAARRSWDEVAEEFRENKHPNFENYQTRRNRTLPMVEPLLAGDRAELARILHAWEAANVRGTKVERHWEPTPFPLERQGA